MYITRIYVNPIEEIGLVPLSTLKIGDWFKTTRYSSKLYVKIGNNEAFLVNADGPRRTVQFEANQKALPLQSVTITYE